MKTRSLLAVLFALSLSVPTLASTIPRDWYTAPEDMPENMPEIASSASEKTEEAGRMHLFHALDEIFEAQAEALRRFDAKRVSGDETDWRIAALDTDLAISASGLLAPATLKGTATATVLWRKKKEEAHVEEPSQGGGAFEYTPGMTREDIKAQLEPMIAMAVKSQKVQGEAKMREDLYQAAGKFRELALALVNDPAKTWWVGRLRLDFWVDVSGTVHPGVVAGAEFKLRFEWHRMMQTTHLRADEGTDSDMQRHFREFVHGLSEDAEAVSYDAFRGTGFRPYYQRYGIGMTASGKFGLVKFGGGFEGYLYLYADVPIPGPHTKPAVPMSTAPLLLIEDKAPDSHLRYARAHDIKYEVEGRGFLQHIIYHLNRWQFRRGMARAVKMSSWFADRAGRIHIGKWRIHEVRAAFELAIGAQLQLVSVAAQGGVEIGIYNENF